MDLYQNYVWDQTILASNDTNILSDCANYCWQNDFLTIVTLGQVSNFQRKFDTLVFLLCKNRFMQRPPLE